VTYVIIVLLVLMFLLYVWSNFVVRNMRCPLCAHLKAEGRDDAHL
jgi:Na+-transporting methylmalonyl-CoA/oxaloacetate decarboxylase gamma subunit